MTTVEENVQSANIETSQLHSEEFKCVPHQLTEVNELTMLITKKLEECASEWATKISKEQQKAVSSNVIDETISNDFLLTRKYFINKDLDESFQDLISCNRNFSDRLTSFIGKLHTQIFTFHTSYLLKNTALFEGMSPTLISMNTRDTPSDSLNPGETRQPANDPASDSLYSESSKKQRSLRTRKEENVFRNALSLRNSFTDVVKAKVNFDAKFLEFEAVLHNTGYGSQPFECNCRFCSNTSGSNTKRIRSNNVSQRKRTVKKRKRLARSPRTVTKRKKKRKNHMDIGDIGASPQIAVN